MKTKKMKEFDCVEMMHRCAQAVQTETAEMTVQEKVAYFRKAAQDLQKRKQAARSKKKTSSTAEVTG